jgi:hypothetical protein
MTRPILVLVLVSVAACASSTEPANGPERIQLAFVDSLVQANCGGTVPLILNGDAAGVANCALPAGVLEAAAAGAQPSRIRVMTPSGPEEWSAIIVERFSPPETSIELVDSSAYVVLYRDTTFTYGAILTVEHLPSETAASGVMYVNNAYLGNEDPFTGPATAVTVGGSCAAATGLRTPLAFPIADCRLATFTLSVPSFGGGEFAAISIATQTVGGVIVGPL